jgi:outer membrane receptor for ferrienterochelin and colicins
MYKWYLTLSSVIILQAIHTSCFAQDYCGAVSIDSAEYRYEIGGFEECIEGLNKCLNNKRGFTSDQKIQAYHLLAKCYLAIDSITKADSVIEELLLLKDNFETDTREAERFKNRVLFIRSNIVSSVSKHSEGIRLAPATTVVITKEEILQRGYTDLIDILKDIPGFDISIYYGQLYANVYQRGFRTNNTERTLLLFDGVEENDLWSNFADISQQYPITNIKRVEVIYGPASTMYGPNAFSGVINVITKEPADYIKTKRSFGINANTGIGSYNTRYVDISTAFKKGIFSFSATARFYNSDRPNLSEQKEWNYDPAVYDDTTIFFGYRRFLSVTENAKDYIIENKLPVKSPLYKVLLPDSSKITLSDSGIILANQLNKALFDRSKDPFGFTKFTNLSQASYISGKINIGDFGLGFAGWVKTEGIGTTFTDLTASVSKSRWIPAHNYIYLNYNKRINDKLLFTTFLNYRIHTIKNGSKITSIKSYSRWGGLEIKDLQNHTPNSWLTTYYYEQSEQFRSEFKLLYNQSKYFYLLSGIELRNSQLQGYYLTSTTSSIPQDYGTYPDLLSPGGNQYNVNDIGIYTQGSYHSKKGFGITLGGRLDYNQIRHGGGLGYNLSPRFVVDYEKKGWVFKTIMSKGIQNVSNFTKFDQVNLIPNPSLKSESIYNYEISVSDKISDAFMADIDFYYSNVKNVVSTVQANHLLQNENIGEFKVKGIQSNLYFKSPNKKWQASVNYTYTDPNQTKGIDPEFGTLIDTTLRIADIATHKMNAIVNFIFLKNFNINLRANYVSSKKTGPGTNLPLNHFGTFDKYITGNMVISAQNLVEGTSIQLICNNIFDKVYYSPGIRSAGGVRYPDSILQMGRNFFIKINFEL